MNKSKSIQLIIFILLGVSTVIALGSFFLKSSRFVLLDDLYAACASYYVSPDARSSEEWISLTQCSNYIDAVLLSLELPERVDLKQDDGSSTFLICPRPDSLWIENNERVFKPSEFVTMFLVYWDRKNTGTTEKLMTSARNSIIEAFAPRYAACLANSF